jgi:protein SCO1/2
MSNTLRIPLLVLVAVAGAAAGMWLARHGAPEPRALALERATLFSSPRAMPPFQLVDDAGDSFGPDRLTGHWSILFFGFTHCPDVCPSTLATLAAVRRELADLPSSARPEVFLVSVDPVRDTPERLAEYVRFFEPSFTGVTGTQESIESLTRALGVAVIVNPPDAQGQYSVDHTATLFLVNPDGAMAGVFGTPHTVDGITHDYRLILAAADPRSS